MSSYSTSNRHGYSVRFSPHDGKRILVATSQLFGLAGGGTLYVLEMDENQVIQEVQQLQWSDGLFDAVWSEQDDHIVVSASGDGTLQLWNLLQNQDTQVPSMLFSAHQSEVYSLDWCKTRCDRKFISASWDSTIRFWDPHHPHSIGTFWGTDGFLKFWSLLDSGKEPIFNIKAHYGEALTCDWSKFDQNLMATGGSDGTIRGWDLRYLRSSLFELDECDFAIRRIRFSPFAPSVVVSAGYDFTTRIWDLQKSLQPIETIQNHSEFVCGVDWNANRENQLADCGWDSLVNVFTPESLKNS